MNEPRTDQSSGPRGKGQWHGLVVDSGDPSALAQFYERLLGMIRVQEKYDWVVIGDSADRPGLAFSLSADYRPPGRPGPDHPAPVHMDIRVDDLDAAEAAIIEWGGAKLDGGDIRHGPLSDEHRVFTDPAGHPFCIVIV